MADTVIAALIIAAGAFVGSILGNVVQPFLAHGLKKWEESRQAKTDSTRAQFDELYRPLYDLFQNRVIPDEGIESLDEKDATEIADLVRGHRQLAEPRLEQLFDEIEYTLYIARSPDHAALAQAYGHVSGKYNALRKRLHLPHEGIRWRFQRWARSTRWSLEWKWSKFRERLASRSRKPKRGAKRQR